MGMASIKRLMKTPAVAISDFRTRRRQLAFYRPLVPKNVLSFDVGANIGNRVGLFLALGAIVVAIEPQPDCARTLVRTYGRNTRFILVEKAVGAASGVATLRVPAASTIASLSPDFISATQESGRFSQYSWDRDLKVEITTLDDLITQFGPPAFCKIDVEGYEAEVLSGLTQPLRSVSFEFTPEVIDIALACIDRLDTIASYEYNLSRGESMEWGLPHWVGSTSIREILAMERYPSWGDVYARSKARE